MRFHEAVIVALMLIMQIPGKEKPMKIEFLGMKDGCPNTPTMWHSLQDAMKELNWDARIDSLDVNELSRQGDMRAGYGSPSILVNGKDLFEASPPATSAPACRYYRGGVPGTAAKDISAELLRRPLDRAVIAECYVARLSISGMSCRRCAELVEYALMGIPGILLAEISYGESQGAIIYNPLTVCSHMISDAVESVIVEDRHACHVHVFKRMPLRVALQKDQMVRI